MFESINRPPEIKKAEEEKEFFDIKIPEGKCENMQEKAKKACSDFIKERREKRKNR